MPEGRKIGWIGIGRMGFPMAERLLKAGHKVASCNRTRAKAERLAGAGGAIVARPTHLAEVDVLFSIVSTGKDLEEVLFSANGVVSGRNGKLPSIVVDCSTIGVEESAAIRRRLDEHGVAFV